MTEQLLTLDEVAGILRISKHTVRSFVRQKKLHPVKFCRRLLFRVSDLDRLIAAYTGQRSVTCTSESKVGVITQLKSDCEAA